MKWMAILSIFIAVSCYGITLEEALQTALEENRELVLSELSLQESIEKLHQAKSSFYPTIELTGGYMRMSSVPVIQFGEDYGIPMGYYDNYSASINLSYPLFTSGKRTSGYQLALLGVEISEGNSLLKEYDMRARIHASFYGLLMAQEGIEIAEEAVHRAHDHLQTVKIQREKGVASQLDLLRAEHSYSQAETEHLRAEKAQETACKALNLLMGIDIDYLTTAEGEIEYLPVEQQVDRLVERAVERRAEMRTMQAASQMASINLNLARFKNAPNLILTLSYSYEKPYQFEEKWGRSLIAALGVQLPLFDGFRNLSEIREAKIGLRKIQTQEDLLRRAVQFEVEKAYLDLKASEAQLSVQEKAQAQAEEALRTAEEQYKRGLISSLEYKDTAFAYTSTQFSYLRTLYQYALSRVRLKSAAVLWD